jgi:hypothetical protein
MEQSAHAAVRLPLSKSNDLATAGDVVGTTRTNDGPRRDSDHASDSLFRVRSSTIRVLSPLEPTWRLLAAIRPLRQAQVGKQLSRIIRRHRCIAAKGVTAIPPKLAAQPSASKHAQRLVTAEGGVALCRGSVARLAPRDDRNRASRRKSRAIAWATLRSRRAAPADDRCPSNRSSRARDPSRSRLGASDRRAGRCGRESP